MLDVVCISLHIEFQKTSNGISFMYYEPVISNAILLFYILELVMKASDNRQAIWTNKWDIFNFTITIVTATIEIISLFLNERGMSKNVIVEQLRVVRVVRALKLVANISNLRVIIKTISVAFKPMFYIGILMLMVLGLFAIIGVTLFGSLKGIENTRKAFRFDSLGTCIAILYQLMTLDNWTDAYMELVVLMDPFLVTVFYVIWITLGAFVFKNVFVGVLVNNFARVDDELRELRLEQSKNNRLGRMKLKLQGELKKVQTRLEKSGSSAFGMLQPKIFKTVLKSEGFLSPDTAKIPAANVLIFPTKAEMNDWDNIIRETRGAILTEDTQVKWSRKQAFAYLQLLSALQEDLEEFYEVNKLAVQLVLEIISS